MTVNDAGTPVEAVTIIEEVAAERERQIEQEGWSIDHDNMHEDGSLAIAAACYAHPDVAARYWPWHDRWWKPKSKRRDLIRAAALIVAEIERLDRASRA